MSNEIFTFGILFGITFISVLITYFAKSNSIVKFSKLKKLAKKINTMPLLKNLLAILLIIVSVFFVWTIVITYMLPTVKNWDTYYTAIQMFTTMLILGGVVATVLGLLRFGMIISTIGIIVVFITKIPYIHFLSSSSSSNLVEAQYGLWIFQCVLLGLSLLIIYLNTFKGRKSSFIYVLACIFALIGELMGRIAFYNLWEIAM